MDFGRKNGAAGGRDVVRAGESDVHNFQEYTYKKITPCDVCSQVLRGNSSFSSDHFNYIRTFQFKLNTSGRNLELLKSVNFCFVSYIKINSIERNVLKKS